MEACHERRHRRPRKRHAPAPERHHVGGPEAPGFDQEVRSYVAGLILAVVLTAVPFVLVYLHAMAGAGLLITIGVFALVQAVIYFRFFLHINPPHHNVDELALIVFTAIILILMAGGTVWILGDLHARMYTRPRRIRSNPAPARACGIVTRIVCGRAGGGESGPSWPVKWLCGVYQRVMAGLARPFFVGWPGALRPGRSGAI